MLELKSLPSFDCVLIEKSSLYLIPHQSVRLFLMDQHAVMFLILLIQNLPKPDWSPFKVSTNWQEVLFWEFLLTVDSKLFVEQKEGELWCKVNLDDFSNAIAKDEFIDPIGGMSQ